MKLSSLARGLESPVVTGPNDVEILDVVYDSRKVAPGALFVALPGVRTNGNRFLREAVDRGASAVISELEAPPAPFTWTRPGFPERPVTWVKVGDAAAALGSAAAEFYGRPSSAVTVVGVTGTNGKTTTTYLLESIFSAAGFPTGALGTVSHRFKGREIEKAANTTPLSADLHRLLRRLADAGAAVVAMEVSSHALALKRVDEIEFDAAVFTNLHRDHLDFHKTREDYLQAKARLFELLDRLPSTKRRRVAVLNRDDDAYARLARLATGAQAVSFGLSAEAEFQAQGLAGSLDGTHFRLCWDGRQRSVHLRLIGEHNVLNALAAAAAALRLGLPENRVIEGLESLASVPGRLEAVDAGQPYHLFVDYAHTDSALAAVLASLKRLPHRRLVTVVGCGGDRDATKRGPMGEAAAAASDLVLLTSDNPRSEDPLAILSQMEEGIKTSGRQNYKIVPDRKEAIQEAVGGAQEGDVLLIAGKGHETVQVLKDKTVRFDDRETAREAIQRSRR